MNSRKNICNSAINKIVVAHLIKEKFNDRYGLFFATSIDLAEKLNNQIGEKATTYHSKLGKKEKLENLKQFSDKRTNVNFLCTAKALNEGFNVEQVSLGICGSGNSKKLDYIQQLGRTLRIQLGKIALFVNLYVPDSQDQKWVESRTEGQDVKWIESINEIEI